MSLKDMLGKGIRFPFTVNEHGGVKMSESIDRINESIFIILETRKGSRLMLPTYGSDIYKYRFDPYDSILIDKLRECIISDLTEWEKRITVKDIEFLTSDALKDQSTLYINIKYNIVNSDVEGNFVYPYRYTTYNTI